ncbi:hypothetical protein LTR17_022017 [Elasticomyces elasticus]|nr:hypothetical protein LTR17_022017 [Elasticomyces elasticus]
MRYAAAAITVLVGTASARQCQNITVEVTVSARNGIFNQTTPATNIDVTNFILNFTQPGMNYSATLINGVLTHGLGFDRSYWDLPYNNYNYSYVKEAVDEYGYSTLAWDRLGTGMSQHGEPVNEIQALLEVDALRALTENLRNGLIPGVSNKFCKVIHVGHSFGSLHTYTLAAEHSSISDGIALTGFSQIGAGLSSEFTFAANYIQANTLPALAAYPNGYLAFGGLSAVQSIFFSPNQFDPGLVSTIFNTQKPITVGEALTSIGETATINNFAGPVLIITGNRDLPFCSGNCLAAPNNLTSIPEVSKKTIPYAKNFEVVIVPNAAHGLNLEYSHPFTYATINNYFIANGLAANISCFAVTVSSGSNTGSNSSSAASATTEPNPSGACASGSSISTTSSASGTDTTAASATSAAGQSVTSASTKAGSLHNKHPTGYQSVV